MLIEVRLHFKLKQTTQQILLKQTDSEIHFDLV